MPATIDRVHSVEKRCMLLQLGAFTVPASLTSGTANGVFRVLAFDGFYQTNATSPGPVSVANHPPQIFLNTPGEPQRVSALQLVEFTASAIDAEDGELSGTNLVWRSSLDGIVGTGRYLTRPASTLQVGEHLITVSAYDSQGAYASQSARWILTAVPPVELAVSSSASNQIRISGATNCWHRLQLSSDLQLWTDYQTNRIPSAGTYLVALTNVSITGPLFIRAVTP